METIIDCFYRLFGGYAPSGNRIWYNCPNCKADGLNKQCCYYVPVLVQVLEVAAEERLKSFREA